MTVPFNTLSSFQSIIETQIFPDSDSITQAQEHNGQLTKPAGSLGRLEELAVWYAGWRGESQPKISNPQVVVFAGNHGVCAQGISVFPQEVTEQMVVNFKHEGAAINQICKTFGAQFEVHALSLDTPTEDFTQAAAMSDEECVEALQAGWQAVDPKADVFITGEMGIGNTTSAAAIAVSLFGGDVETWVGRGTGVDDQGFARKIKAVSSGLNLHGALSPLETLRCLGGREIAAMAGAIASARDKRIPVILDGFICTSAAAVLHKISDHALDHVVAGHLSAEGAHRMMLDAFDKKPLLQLDLRLGEASGAALALSVLQAAVACHSQMATFEQASVSR